MNKPKITFITFLALTITIFVYYSYHRFDIGEQTIFTGVRKLPSKLRKLLLGNSIKCFELDGYRLPDISTFDVRKGKSIFFHETSCNSYISGKLIIKARQACAVESAAKMNPNLDVYLTYSSPGVLVSEGNESDRILEKLLEYKNIKILHLNYETYTRGTLLEDLYKSGDIGKGDFALSHASDVLRYLTLYKYGGIYLDLDVLVLKNLESLGPNLAGLESDYAVGSSIIGFDYKCDGHKHAENCLLDLKNNFNPYNWAANGPGVITRLLKSLCDVKEAKDMLDKACGGVKVYPMETFFPIRWWNWSMYFDPENIEDLPHLEKESYIVHVWNKMSEKTPISKNTKTLYTILAERQCPKVFKEVDDYI